VARCSYSLGESGIKWQVTMKTKNAAGETVPFAALPRDREHIEFRSPSGIFHLRDAEYDEAAGRLTYDQGGARDRSLLNETGAWAYRGSIERATGEVIRSSWSGRFWVVE